MSKKLRSTFDDNIREIEKLIQQLKQKTDSQITWTTITTLLDIRTQLEHEANK